MAQKAHQPTPDFRAQVEKYAAVGLPHAVIGTLIGISEVTLEKYYPDELAAGTAKGNAQIAGWAFDSARRGNIPMRIFLCKVRLGWRERTALEVTGKDGAAITPILQINWTNGDGKS